MKKDSREWPTGPTLSRIVEDAMKALLKELERGAVLGGTELWGPDRLKFSLPAAQAFLKQWQHPTAFTSSLTLANGSSCRHEDTTGKAS